MRAIAQDTYGPPSILEVRDLPRPQPKADEVLIRVRASSINPADRYVSSGTPKIARVSFGLFKPSHPTPGMDVAGVVEALGSDVTQFSIGDEVFGDIGSGAYAEYATGRVSGLALKPPSMSFEEAAAMPVAAMTALQGVRDKAEVKAGQRVLINGASGGVGTYAVQIAKYYGADVTGVCSTKNVDLVQKLGADHVIDYTKEDFVTAGEPWDVLIDNVGNRTMRDCNRALQRDGIYLMIGAPNKGAIIGPAKGILRAALYFPFVRPKLKNFVAKSSSADLGVLAEMVEEGALTSVIDRTFTLEEVPAAIEYLNTGRTRGKNVISIR